MQQAGKIQMQTHRQEDMHGEVTLLEDKVIIKIYRQAKMNKEKWQGWLNTERGI